MKYIQDFTIKHQINKIIDNKKSKGIFFSLSKGILVAKGQFILFLQSEYILSKNIVLFELYTIITQDDLDILEFSLFLTQFEIVSITIKIS